MHLIADRLEDLSQLLSDLGHPLGTAIRQTTAKTDNAPRPLAPSRTLHPRQQAKRLFPSRDFH